MVNKIIDKMNIGKVDYGKLLNKFGVVIICVVMIASLFTVNSYAADNGRKTVKIGYYNAANFQEYDEETGIYRGYSYEFLMALQQYTNWKYEFVPCTFAEGLEMLKNGEIDMMNNVSKTPERESIYEFSTLDSGQNVAYLAMKKGDTRVAYNDLEAISKIKIGLARDSIYSDRLETYLKNKNVSPNIVWYDTREDVAVAFDNGDVDAYIITSSTQNSEHIILSFSPDAYYIATTKGNTELVQEIDAAITSFRQNDPYFELHLRDKYYGETTENYTILTEDEQNYLKENPVAKVMYFPDWYPMSYKDSKGEFAGAIRGVYDLIEERTGLKFEYVPIDENTVEADISKEYGAQIIAEQPTDFSGIGDLNVKLTKSFVSPTLTEVANHVLTPGDTIGLVEGDYLTEVCEKLYGDKYEYKYYDSVEDCLKATKKKAVDGTVLITYESEYYRIQRGYSSLVYTIVDDGNYSLSIAVSNEADPRLYSIIQKGLNSISNGEISNIFNNTLVSSRSEDFLTYIYNNPFPWMYIIGALFILIIAAIVSFIFLRKLRRQNKIINEKNDALEIAHQTTTNFFSRMSHDMRTPMNGILGMVRLSRDEKDAEVIQSNIDKIEDSGEYLLSLINDTLDFQRIESGNLKINPEFVRWQDIIDSILAMVKPTIDKKNLTLKIDSKNVDLDRYILVDPVRLKQIFMNLISNAIKFTPDGGAIHIDYECLGIDGMIAHDKFVIRDTGIGMSEEFMKEYLFKPFSQEQSAVTGQYAGSGLGLSIVKNLVEAMGGTITVESELGEGTKFTILMDIERVDSQKVNLESKTAEERRGSVRDVIKGKRILLAEDHPLNAEIATKLLERVGCIVTWVKNGEECVNTFNESSPGFFDAILMDIRMPILTGLEAAEKIRGLERSDAKAVKIIAMTANAYDSDVDSSLAAGMDGHIAKPVEPKVLYDTLVKYLSE